MFNHEPSHAKRIRDFVLLNDSEKVQLLQEASKHLCASLVWTKGQELLLDTHVTHLSIADACLYTWAPPSVDPDKLNTFFKKTLEKTVFFSISHPLANLFFQAEYRRIHTGSLQFSLPEKVYKIERRQNLRLLAQGPSIGSVTLPDPLFPKERIMRKIADLSTTGLAFFSGLEATGLYHPGQILPFVEIKLHETEGSCGAECEIKHVTPIKGKSRTEGAKIGMNFLNIEDTSKLEIASFISKRNRTFLKPSP